VAKAAVAARAVVRVVAVARVAAAARVATADRLVSPITLRLAFVPFRTVRFVNRGRRQIVRSNR
jgi:hypothetical protein